MTEQEYWPAVCEAWHNRARDLELNPKTKRYTEQQLAFLQGALAVATATGVMPMGRAHTLAMLACVGRGEMVLPEPKPEDDEPATDDSRSYGPHHRLPTSLGR